MLHGGRIQGAAYYKLPVGWPLLCGNYIVARLGRGLTRLSVFYSSPRNDSTRVAKFEVVLAKLKSEPVHFRSIARLRSLNFADCWPRNVFFKELQAHNAALRADPHHPASQGTVVAQR